MRELLPLLAIAALAIPPVHGDVGPSEEPFDVLGRALSFLETNADHDISEYFLEATISAGQDPGLWPTPANNLVDRLIIPDVGTPGNDPIREIHAIAQSGYDARNFRGQDLVSNLAAAWDRSNQGAGQATFTILALRAAGVPKTDATFQDALEILQTGQYPDGGWACIGLPSPDCTGFALTGLRAADGFLPGMEARANIWLDTTRQANGGYGNGGLLGSDPFAILGVESPAPALTASNTQSTIWAVHGYRALRQPVPHEIWEYLRSMQMQDGGFAWKDGDTKSNLWATTEVVAGWARSFHDLPQYAPTRVAAPQTVEVGLAMPFGLEDEQFAATWRVLDTNTTGTGNPATLRMPHPGQARIHVEATAPGLHHREKFTVTVTNQAPRFLALPTSLVTNRIDPLRLTVLAEDPTDGPVPVTWSIADDSGSGPIEVRLRQLGPHVLALQAIDRHGLAATAAIPVTAVNLAPVIRSADVPTLLNGNTTIALHAVVEDPEGSAIDVTWGNGQEVATGTTASLRATEGANQIQLTIRDADGAQATRHWTVMVGTPTAPPASQDNMETGPVHSESPAAPQPTPQRPTFLETDVGPTGPDSESVDKGSIQPAPESQPDRPRKIAGRNAPSASLGAILALCVLILSMKPNN